MNRFFKRYFLFILLLGLLFSYKSSSAQDEFLVFGTIKISGQKVDSTIITVETDKRQFGRTIILDSAGEFKIWLKYSKDYIIKFSKKEYQSVPIAVSTKLPDNIAKCCFTPFDLSFHLFKPDGKHDSLFKKPIVTVRYEQKLKSFYYSLDLDYYIQKMYIKSETDRKNKLNDMAFIAKHKDSLEIERKYNGLINSGNLYYSMHQFSMAQRMFEKALELRPKRRYPSYKLEDIETQIQIFNKAKDSLPKNADSLIASIMTPKQETKSNIEYKRKTPEEIESIFKNDLINQIKSETPNKKELTKRLEFVNNEVINKKETIVIKDSTSNNIISTNDTCNNVIPVKKDSSIISNYIPVIVKTDSSIKKTDTVTNVNEFVKQINIDTTKQVTNIPKEKPKNTLVKPEYETTKRNKTFDKAAYQDSLSKKYPNERTVEIITEPYKKITKVIINQNNSVNIYLKVEHNWGGLYFFKDNTPYPMENISKSYFEVATKLLKDKVMSQPQNKNQSKNIQNKTSIKHQKK